MDDWSVSASPHAAASGEAADSPESVSLTLARSFMDDFHPQLVGTFVGCWGRREFACRLSFVVFLLLENGLQRMGRTRAALAIDLT